MRSAKFLTTLDPVPACQITLEIHTRSVDPNVLFLPIVHHTRVAWGQNVGTLVPVHVVKMQNVLLSITYPHALVDLDLLAIHTEFVPCYRRDVSQLN